VNIADLRAFDDKGLLLRRQDLLGEATSLRFHQATDQLQNSSQLRITRRAIARVNTVIRERERERTLPQGGLALAVGKLEPDETAFAAFRKRFGSEE
jgi:large subunit ribosomal protein L29